MSRVQGYYTVTLRFNSVPSQKDSATMLYDTNAILYYTILYYTILYYTILLSRS